MKTSLPEGNALSTVNEFAEPPKSLPRDNIAEAVRTFAQQLKKFMDALEIHPSELARRVKADPSQVHHWLKGRREPSAQHLLAAAVVLRLTPYELYGSNFEEPTMPAEPVRRGRPPKASLVVVVDEPAGPAAAAEGPPAKPSEKKLSGPRSVKQPTKKPKPQAE